MKEIFFYRSIKYYEYGEAFYGSHKGHRFRIARKPLEDVHFLKIEDRKNDEAVLELIVWNEPLSFDNTPDEEKQSFEFSFDDEGMKRMESSIIEMFS